MPTTLTQWKNLELSNRYYECGGIRDVKSIQFRREKTSIDNVTQTRVRPAEPLWLHPTALPLQSELIGSWGYYLQGDHVFFQNSTCNGLPFKIYRDIYNGNNSPGIKQGTGPDTNWALKARQRIQDLSVNLAQPLHEYREAAKMFQFAASGVHEAWKSFRKTKRGLFRVSPCAVPAAHLMATYGIMPLVGQVFDSVLQLNGRLSNPIYRRFRVKDVAKAPVNTGVYRGQWETSEVAVFYVEFETENPGLFTLSNPLSLAWETVPYSFVVDWLIPIGDHLAALDALKDVKSLTGTLTRKEKYWHVKTENPQGGSWLRIPRVDYRSHKRSVISTIPMPRLPLWKPSDSYRKIVNGLALLGSLNQRCR